MSRATRKPLLIRCRAFQNTGLVSSPISPLDCKSRVQWRKEHTLCQCGLSDLNYTRIRMEARPPMFCSIAPIAEGFNERSVNLYLCLVMATNRTLRAKHLPWQMLHSMESRCRGTSAETLLLSWYDWKWGTGWVRMGHHQMISLPEGSDLSVSLSCLTIQSLLSHILWPLNFNMIKVCWKPVVHIFYMHFVV